MTGNQRIRLGMAVSATLIVLYIVWLARGGLAPFLLGAFLAYLISPLVTRVSKLIRLRWNGAPWVHTAAIVIVYLVFLGIVTGIGALIIPQLIDSVNKLIAEQDTIVASVQSSINDWYAKYNENVPDSVREWINSVVASAGKSAGSWLGAIAGNVVSRVLSSIAAAIGFLVVPFWMFMVLKDQRGISRGFYSLFPDRLRPDVRYMTRDADRVLSSYLRAALTLGLVVGVISYIGLRLLNAPFALALAIIAGVGEVIPIVGPIIAGAIAVTVVMAIDPGITALWVLLLAIGIQQVENIFLAPKIHGDALRIHPALIIMLVLIGGQLFGTLGMALTPPLFAIVRNSFVYVYRRLDGMPKPSHAAQVNEAARRARMAALASEEASAEPAQ